MNHWNVPKSPSESYYSLRASRALERAFLPIKTEALARYIFSPSPRIPSKAFGSSLVLHITHKLTHSGLSDPRRAFLSPSVVLAPRTESSTVHLVLTPLEYISGALVGVVSAAGVTKNGTVMPFAEALNNGIRSGRFVYDGDRNQIVTVLDDMAPDAMGVVAAKWRNDASHERVFFAIPKMQYSFDYMPKKALVMLTNLEYQISKILEDGTSPWSSKTPDKLFEMPETHDGNMPANNSLQTVDALNLQKMTDAIGNIARSMVGVYYGPNVKRDEINIATGELSSRASGKMVCRLVVPDYDGQCKIRRMVAQDYFIKLLPPGSERWFMQNESEANLGLRSGGEGKLEDELDEDEGKIAFDPVALAELDAFEAIIPDGDCKPYVVPLHEPRIPGTTHIASTGVPPLLGGMIPRYNGAAALPRTTAITSGVPQPSQTVLSEEELKERKEKERRIRNRLSAARSNEKRKLRERDQRQELESLRERKTALENVRQHLMDENNMLRKLAGV